MYSTRYASRMAWKIEMESRSVMDLGENTDARSLARGMNHCQRVMSHRGGNQNQIPGLSTTSVCLSPPLTLSDSSCPLIHMIYSTPPLAEYLGMRDDLRDHMHDTRWTLHDQKSPSIPIKSSSLIQLNNLGTYKEVYCHTSRHGWSRAESPCG